jgi:GAF domain-containing protein
MSTSPSPFAAPIAPALMPRRLVVLPQTIQRLCGEFEREEIDRSAFLEQCTRVVCAGIGCSRVGIWIFMETAGGLALRCVAMYDGVTDRMVRVADETQDVEAYFRALEAPGYVVAADARSHVATTGFFADRLEARGVRSLLAASFSVNGAVYGAFTCTQVDHPADWTPAQLGALRQIAARTSLGLFRRSRFTPNTGPGPLVV